MNQICFFYFICSDCIISRFFTSNTNNVLIYFFKMPLIISIWICYWHKNKTIRHNCIFYFRATFFGFCIHILFDKLLLTLRGLETVTDKEAQTLYLALNPVF